MTSRSTRGCGRPWEEARYSETRSSTGRRTASCITRSRRLHPSAMPLAPCVVLSRWERTSPNCARPPSRPHGCASRGPFSSGCSRSPRRGPAAGILRVQRSPADQTGGDFFDYIDLLDGRTALVIGDVSGHGIDAAIVMATTRAYIRSTALSHPDPGALLTRVNRVLVADLQQNQFVTTLIACIDCPSRSLTFASAGHIEGYVLDEAGAVKARLGSTGIPLGIFPDSATETALCPALKNGDVMVIFTDGVTEAEDGTGQAFGFERALGVVAAQRREPAAVIVDRLCHAVRDFSGPVPQADDITAVVCKCSDTGLDTHP